MAVSAAELGVKTFTITEEVPAFRVGEEEVGLHDVSLVGVQVVTGVVDGEEVGHIVWHRKFSSVVIVDNISIPNPLFGRRVRSAERKAGQIAAGIRFLVASRSGRL